MKLRKPARRSTKMSAALPRALVKHAPERMLWASNWPHPSAPRDNIPDDADLIDLLLDWAPDEATRKQDSGRQPRRALRLSVSLVVTNAIGLDVTRNPCDSTSAFSLLEYEPAVAQDATQPALQEYPKFGLLRERDLSPFGFLRLDMRPAHAVWVPPGSWGVEVLLGYQNSWMLSPNVEEYLKSLPGRRRLGTQMSMPSVRCLARPISSISSWGWSTGLASAADRALERQRHYQWRELPGWIS